MRVLVVEDQVDLGDVFRDFLVELGHHPLVVHTAEAELERRPEKRRSTRARLTLPARLCEYNGREHEGTLLEVGVSGMKAHFAASLDTDTIGRAIFTPPDGGPPIEVIAILVRADPDGQAFTFVRLDPRDAERLRDLVRRTP